MIFEALKWEVKEVLLIPVLLDTNPQLQKLLLVGWTDLLANDYDTVIRFAAALSMNFNLEQLILRDSDYEADQILVKATYNDSSMNSVVLSNHTCCILYL